jgi:hypothetical protein
MNVTIQEDSRALREFYPDPALRHQVHYAFAHRFLPQYVQQNPYAFFSYIFRQDMPGGAMEPTRFIHSRWTMFEEMVGLIQRESDPFRDGMVFRRVADLTMSTQEVAGRPVALVQMPTPEQPVEVFFVAVALLASPAHPGSWPRDVQARVFTLEAEFSEHPGEGTTGVVCEWTKEGEHRNFGFGVRAERDAFLRAVTAALQASDAPARASFTPPNEGASVPVTLRAGGDPPPPQQPQLPPQTRRPWWKIW